MKKFLIITILITFSEFGVSQENSVKDMSFSERVFFGGNFGLQFGNITFIDISPLVGYRVTDRSAAGAGISYMYYREYFPGIYEFSTSIYGGRLFGRYFILDNIFAHAEYEVLNLESYYDQRRLNVVSLLGGGGYRQHIGGRTFLNAMILWNFNESAYSPYRNPIIRMGINFGL
jgi:hypothetical protein